MPYFFAIAMPSSSLAMMVTWEGCASMWRSNSGSIAWPMLPKPRMTMGPGKATSFLLVAICGLDIAPPPLCPLRAGEAKRLSIRRRYAPFVTHFTVGNAPLPDNRAHGTHDEGSAMRVLYVLLGIIQF